MISLSFKAFMIMVVAHLDHQIFKLSFNRVVACFGRLAWKLSYSWVGARFVFKYWVIAHVFLTLLVLYENRLRPT